MEYLDYYDEEGNYLGYETRDIVHQEGLWHKTVQNWLYTKDGKVFFQIRANSGKLYTTSSGHVAHGETVEDAFRREIKEEIGIDCDYKNAKMIELVTWRMDKTRKDGSVTKDRAKSSFFIVPYDGDYSDFKFDTNEVLGLGLVDAKEALDMFEAEEGEIEATMILANGDGTTISKKMVSMNDFLIFENEKATAKYGHTLKEIIEATKK